MVLVLLQQWRMLLSPKSQRLVVLSFLRIATRWRRSNGIASEYPLFGDGSIADEGLSKSDGCSVVEGAIETE